MCYILACMTHSCLHGERNRELDSSAGCSCLRRKVEIHNKIISVISHGPLRSTTSHIHHLMKLRSGLRQPYKLTLANYCFTSFSSLFRLTSVMFLISVLSLYPPDGEAKHFLSSHGSYSDTEKFLPWLVELQRSCQGWSSLSLQ